MLTNQKEQIEQFINILLKNTQLKEFAFCQFYTLIFSRDGHETFNNALLPQNIALHIESDWWFDSKQEWENRIKQFPISNSPHNEEPVKAYELSMIMWSEDNAVDNVTLGLDDLKIKFKSGRVLNIKNIVEYSEAWLMYESGVREQEWKWHVGCEFESEIWAKILGK
ncbi:hypothetical protein SAMN02745163_04367 [Clostridium cavendishii DSM 21758]|uniref:Uncharacterized protein n=1 Tax=Clostridium cavendishii DSM 21758 TaxID=1121302 RepID=A0A1M6UVY9_9CLOT|nr:hypothetical protein [Clostridium cavendishii]SHK73407.1 hypothetical protein SAMN02745163_04367 [Clostridium cavendishii DSM 21758]